MKLAFTAGFIAGAVSMWGVILWIYADREGEMVDLTFESPNGSGQVRGRLVEWSPS